MKMRCLTAALMPLLLSSNLAAGQVEYEQPEQVPRVFIGGNFGIQFGTITNIEISPLAGYNLTPSLSAGAGLHYEFHRNSGNGLLYSNYQTGIYGASVFTRYMFFKNIGERISIGITGSLFTHAEYEVLSLEKKFFEIPPTSEEGRFLLHSVLVGGGIYQPLGPKGGAIIMILWNLNESASSPYNNPIMRVGFIYFL